MTSSSLTAMQSLTQSFGWSDADAFTQHDVQELCRVLFDAIEQSFKGTKNEDVINQLYQGNDNLEATEIQSLNNS